MRKSAAFTLAEVLITLGIIGVVAAMTIPTLISNMKGARIRSQFKKEISTLNQAARLNLANHDWDFSAITFEGDENYADKNDCLYNGATHTPDTKTTVCALFNANLTGATFWSDGIDGKGYYLDRRYYTNPAPKYITSSKYSGFWQGSSPWYIYYQLSDGAIVGINTGFNNCSKSSSKFMNVDGGDYCVGFIDINGTQLPNKEIECSDPSKTRKFWDDDYEECTVKITGDTGDVFPIAFYDSTVVPSTNAGKYILNTAK